jgi:uncharacterized protein (TIGR03437 family)
MANSSRIACAVAFGFRLFAGVAQAQPVVIQVSNAASYLVPPLPGSSIAQGSFFVVLASPSTSSSALSPWDVYPHPTTLGGMSVAVSVGGVTTNAFIYYVGPNWNSSGMQIDAVLPSTTPTGAGTVVVTQNGVSSPTFRSR